MPDQTAHGAQLLILGNHPAGEGSDTLGFFDGCISRAEKTALRVFSTKPLVYSSAGTDQICFTVETPLCFQPIARESREMQGLAAASDTACQSQSVKQKPPNLISPRVRTEKQWNRHIIQVVGGTSSSDSIAVVSKINWFTVLPRRNRPGCGQVIRGVCGIRGSKHLGNLPIKPVYSEVAAIDPYRVKHNYGEEVEGVMYRQFTAVLVNYILFW